ncbi:TetR family transcriptional regulator [Frankia sp. CcI156]|jgi:AcrR family transcriptional regulator|uniref:Transcriptional regulator, TetR family n=1 Tax=Frankia casuarinae (strain DSM 45818 / CECT 9043 / HFP020203 / CcI3) TaxID=106370 RepID=Q2J5F7_FRACC|nr:MULTISPECIES: TetR family transcriptional regulator [Frankia]ABD13485.1 transcriptional regulator, TetR family [Frankia casuarinae]ETA00045.1 transcriptional regulator, TetR family [Frankia sp. CcI6]EYT90424.1 transcriptional regulator, TetR family [Frankia casuarinae]KDA42193.1 transcriptional regulator, TetR family [Frankia sp. BMG5.23]KFB02736.1 transcriptional regulator, TetR family [Frankia sp. Allo2]
MAGRPTRAPRHAEAERNDRALLDAARQVLAADGAHASVAAIAARAGVGIGSLYRRYRTKEELFQRLSMLSLESWNAAAESALAIDDPWTGLAEFVRGRIEFGQGSLAPIAGTIEVTEQMQAAADLGDELLGALVERARQAGVLRGDVSHFDVSLLIEQLGRSHLLEQVRGLARDDLFAAAAQARARIIAIALDGLRAENGPARASLPGSPPTSLLFDERWVRRPASGDDGDDALD